MNFFKIAVGAAALMLLTNLAAADDVKKLSAGDLAVQTHKWDGKMVESQFQCFYADKDEFRCMGGFGEVRVDFSSLNPPDLKSKIENNCDTIKALRSKSCKVTIRFEYDGFDTLDNNGGTTMHVVIPKFGSGQIIP